MRPKKHELVQLAGRIDWAWIDAEIAPLYSDKGRPGCQSAFKFAPRSASNVDPFVLRGLVVALAPTEPVGVAEAARARLSGRSSSRLLKRQLSLPVSTMSQ